MSCEGTFPYSYVYFKLLNTRKARMDRRNAERSMVGAGRKRRRQAKRARRAEQAALIELLRREQQLDAEYDAAVDAAREADRA